MNIIESEAIVLRKKELLHKDILLTLFTEQEGQITVIAKGVRKITSRRAPHIQTGNLINVTLQRRSEITYLGTSSLISGFSSIKDNSQKTSCLYIFFFILNRLLPENQQENDVYQLTKHFLVDMAKIPNFSMEAMTSYLNDLLAAFGYTKGTKSLEELLRFTEGIINEKIPQHII